MAKYRHPNALMNKIVIGDKIEEKVYGKMDSLNTFHVVRIPICMSTYGTGDDIPRSILEAFKDATSGDFEDFGRSIFEAMVEAKTRNL